MFKKITFILLGLSLAFLMSCEDGAGSANSEAGKEVAMEAAGMAMVMAMQITPTPAEEAVGLSLSRAAAETIDPGMITTRDGLTVSGTYTGGYTGIDYNLESILNMAFDNVKSDDNVWTMNGNLTSILSITFIGSTGSFSMDGSLTGNLSVSDGSNDYSFTFNVTQTLSTTATGFSCTVNGTIVSGSSTITIDETFTFSS